MGVFVMCILLGWAALATATPKPLKFQWTYTAGVPNHGGFQMMRCETAPPTGTCAPSTGITGTIPPAERTWTETSAAVGKRYCWGVRAIAVVEPHSGVSNAVCETIVDDVTPPMPDKIPAPTEFKKVP